MAEHPSDRSAIVASASAFDLYTYLENGLHRYKSGEMSSSQFWEMISPFVKKFEVFKRLYDTYGTDLLKSTGAQPASLACYVLFANCLAEYAERSRSLNALSTLLKLNDTLASVATDQMYSEVAEMLVRCIETELRLVDLIEKHSWDLP
ncbi:MAG: hypothetical protein HQ503_12620 [Rhodospirillales bacterium]|nr:hypothetical protein [Rhodospirillales bacterium]